MAVGLIGMLDLSIVTDRLIELIDDAVASTPLWSGGGAPFTLQVSGSAPESVRPDGGCQVSLYLFHVARDPYQANVPLNAPYQLNGTPPPPPPWLAIPQPPPRAYEAPYFPLGLDLYYLLTAYSDKTYVQEQQAMSVAMTCLHENPIVTTTVVLDGEDVEEEFAVTLAVEGEDELSRLWQATTAALRLSAVYKVSPVFLAPQTLEDKEAPPVERVVATADAVDLPLDPLGDLSGSSFTASYALPEGTERAYDLAPAVAAPGDTIVLHGAGLDQDTAARVFLLPPGAPRIEVTAWRTDTPKSKTSARIELPAASGGAPGATPEAGVYQLAVGSDTSLGDATTHMSRLTPFSIAAGVEPGGTALLAAVAGVYSLTGEGFVDGQTEVLLGTVPLSAGGSPPAAGAFFVGGAGTTIDFAAPASLASGRYAVRVRVNGIESRPAWWVDL